MTTPEFSACAYTAKVEKMCEMLKLSDHTVIHYGNGSNPPSFCDKHIEVLTDDELRVEKGYNIPGWENKTFEFSRDDWSCKEFNSRGKRLLNENLQPNDYVLIFFGQSHAEMISEVSKRDDIFVVEAGIGYDSSFCKYRVFESNSMLAWEMGSKRLQFPNANYTIIPNYFRTSEFTQSTNPSYWLYLGRKNVGKGLDMAIQACIITNQKLIIVGQETDEGAEWLKNLPQNIEVRGFANVEERKKLFSGAIGTFLMSRYLEPFGGVAVESELSGVPVITSRRGGFTERNTCIYAESLSEIIERMGDVYSINRDELRNNAIKNYSLESLRHRYDDFFSRIFYNKYFGPNVIPHPRVENKRYDIAYFGDAPFTYEGGVAFVCGKIPIIFKDTNLIKDYDKEILVCDEPSHLPVIIDYHPVLPYIADLGNATINNITVSSIETDYSELFFDLKDKYSPISAVYVSKSKSPPSPNFNTTGRDGIYYHEYTENPIINEKLKIAYWTRKEWAFGRIFNAIQKYSIHNVEYFDWGDLQSNIDLFKNGKWKEYHAILGNSELSHFPITQGWITEEDKEEYFSKIRPTVHAPITDNKYYIENLKEGPLHVSAVNADIALGVKTKFPQMNVYVTPSGFDPDVFAPFKTPQRDPQTLCLGFIGMPHIMNDEFKTSESVEEVKRSMLFDNIVTKTGTNGYYIFDNPLDLGANMYSDVDIMVCTSLYEGGPLGMLEAMASGVPAISTNVGLMKELDILKFDTEDEAAEIIKMLKDPDKRKEYTQVCLNEVQRFNWLNSIKPWDSFASTSIKDFTKPQESQPPNVVSKGTHTPLNNDKASKTFAHMMNKPCKLMDGSLYDPGDHKDDAHLYKPTKL